MSYIFGNSAAAMRRAAKATYTVRVQFNGLTGTVNVPKNRTLKFLSANSPLSGTLSLGTTPAGTELLDAEAVSDVPFPIEIGYNATDNTTLYITSSTAMVNGWIDFYIF